MGSAASSLRSAVRLARGVRREAGRLPPMLGARPRELATMATIAMLAGDWPTAVEAARDRLRRRPGDEGALVALAVGLWELGRDDEARATVALGAPPVAPARARAAARFHHHTDDVLEAQAALDALGEPDPGLALGIGQGWRRHAEFGRALAAADRVLAADPGNRAAVALRRDALAERAVLDGSWAPPAPVEGIERVPGRVLHLLQWTLPERGSGSTFRTHYVTQAQLAAGLEPEVVTQPGSGWRDGCGVELHSGVPHHRLPPARPDAALDEQLRWYLEGAARVVERVRPAVLHPASDYVNALVALELGRRYGLPVVYEVRGFPEMARARWAGSRAAHEKALWRRQVEAECWRSADRLVTLAEVMRDRIEAHGVDPARIAVIPNAVDAERFGPVEPDPALRAQLGLPAGELVLGYVSRLFLQEGISTLLAAAARLVAQGRRVRVLLVGEGLEQAHLRQLARRLGIGDRVVLTGLVAHEDVAAYYALIDVFVVPRYDVDDFGIVTPMKPYEAMAAGKAVVVSGTPALREMVSAGETGEVFRSGDVEDLVRVLARLADDPAHRRELGLRARAWVGSRRTWREGGERYVRLYEQLGAP